MNLTENRLEKLEAALKRHPLTVLRGMALLYGLVILALAVSGLLVWITTP